MLTNFSHIELSNLRNSNEHYCCDVSSETSMLEERRRNSSLIFSHFFKRLRYYTVVVKHSQSNEQGEILEAEKNHKIFVVT